MRGDNQPGKVKKPNPSGNTEDQAHGSSGKLARREFLASARCSGNCDVAGVGVGKAQAFCR